MISPTRPLAAVLLVMGAIVASFGSIQFIHEGHLHAAGWAHLVIGVALLFAGGRVLGRAP